MTDEEIRSKLLNKDNKVDDKLLNQMFDDLGGFDGLGSGFLGGAGGGGNNGYKPYGDTAKILDQAMEHINSVDYQVSVRWVFYRLLQEGLYRKKDDYMKFIRLTSRARHNYYNGWNPLTLVDETRSMIVEGYEGERPGVKPEELFDDAEQESNEEIEELHNQLNDFKCGFDYEIDPTWYQDTICIIMFEARAMVQQFKKYTSGLTLCPFGGHPSIPYKYNIAKYLENQAVDYEKAITVLYFGDCDDGGYKIYQASMRDISEWCGAEINFVRCGLTEEQAVKYGIPENFEKPGSYQWEALPDSAAEEIITESLAQYHDSGAVDRAYREGLKITAAVSDEVNERLGE